MLDVAMESTLEAAGAALVSLTGDLDLASAQDFRTSLARREHAAGENIVLDVTRLGFLDSSGLAAIIDLHLQLQAEGAKLAIVCGDGQVARIFRITDVHRFVNVAATRADAFATFSAATG